MFEAVVRQAASLRAVYTSVPMRRPFGLFMMLLFLNLMLGSSELVCEKHGSERASSEPAGMAMHHHGQPAHSEHTDQTSHTGHQHQSGKLPLTEPCCPAMASCGLTAVTEAASGVSNLAVYEATPTSIAHALLSRATAPETPPPRV